MYTWKFGTSLSEVSLGHARHDRAQWYGGISQTLQQGVQLKRINANMEFALEASNITCMWDLLLRHVVTEKGPQLYGTAPSLAHTGSTTCGAQWKTILAD